MCPCVSVSLSVCVACVRKGRDKLLSFIVSSNSTEYNIKTIDMTYAGATDISRSKSRKECVIMNYTPVSQVNLKL